MAAGSAIDGALGGREDGVPATHAAIPLSYLEDPEQLSTYRWRAVATTTVLLVLLGVLSWVAGELLRSVGDLLRSIGEAVRLTG